MKFEIPVEIKSTEVNEKRGITREGSQYQIREQYGYVDFAKPYPIEIKVALDTTMAPYSPGTYVVDPKCLYVDRYGQLALGRIKLIPNTGALKK